MCAPLPSTGSTPDRRAVLRASASVPLLLLGGLGAGTAVAAPAGAEGLTGLAGLGELGGLEPPAAAGVRAPRIHPRADWAAGRRATGRMQTEDVRFLLVHHTQTPNTDSRDGVPGRLRGMFAFHTGDKGWPDIAYNFLVDRFGGVWEGRTGSLAGPVRGDATGGSQGFAQLCCFIGDHTSQPPTPEAMASMSQLLAWLAARYQVGLAANRQVAFVSRGSNRWPRGRRVTTTPIAAHRDMSLTECPGDALYPLVRSQLWPRARRLAGSGGQASATQATPTSGTALASPSAGAVESGSPPASTGASTSPSGGPSSSPSGGASPRSTPSVSGSATSGGSTVSAGTTPSAQSQSLVHDALPVLGVAGIGGGTALAAYALRRGR